MPQQSTTTETPVTTPQESSVVGKDVTLDHMADLPPAVATGSFGVEVPSWEAVMFLGGIACVAVSLIIPFHILGHGEQR